MLFIAQMDCICQQARMEITSIDQLSSQQQIRTQCGFIFITNAKYGTQDRATKSFYNARSVYKTWIQCEMKRKE